MAIPSTSSAIEDQPLPEIAEKTKGMKKFGGFFNFYWDEQAGKIWLEVAEWGREFLYINSLPAGVGSNDIGLDRGQLKDGRIVRFERIGPKVLLIQPNYGFRAVSQNAQERKSVEEAFAQSVLWGFEVAAGRNMVLVDATGFLMQDVHDVSGTLASSGQGVYQLDASRSAIYPERTKSFPRNTEFEALLTFLGKAEGEFVMQVVPTPNSVTVRQHHSFVALPDDKYQPRVLDPRSGYWGISYQDYATPISEPLVKHFIGRHRLEKKNPAAERSEAKVPIIYYVDPGAPEPIRSALMEGALWWSEAFEALGYENAFQVKLLPVDADPMDARYNVIQWVHRATRGWSYGQSIVDPRTGEIVKGQVTLGSLRVRQDFLIAQGLLSPYAEDGSGSAVMEEMALARLRQLSAHEVGHTLGLIHNFAASAADRASVMDYPHPYILIDNGAFDVSDAYGIGIGAWDKAAIAYGYADFPTGTDENRALNEIIQGALDRGLLFISDQDARPGGGAHPLAHLWDNGPDAVRELDRMMAIRRTALDKFSDNAIPLGAPLSNLEKVLVPLYLSHRYQVEAASKLIGGLYYTYGLRGDGQKITEVVAPDQQKKALESVLRTLTPQALALPERLIRSIPPPVFGDFRDHESFHTRTGVTFDPLAAAETAADYTIQFLMHPERLARLVEYHARDASNPGPVEVLDQILACFWKADNGQGYHAEVRRVVDEVILGHLMGLCNHPDAATQVRAIASMKLEALRQRLSSASETVEDEPQIAHLRFAVKKIELFQSDPDKVTGTAPLVLPAGSPIGQSYCDW